jgi:arginine exporter protein ArgO
VLLIIAYIGVSFIIDSCKETWLILLLGGAAYVIFILFLSSKNAYANRHSGKMRVNVFIIFFAVTMLIYFSVSFLTESWTKTWLIILDIFVFWNAADALLSKVKYNGMPMPFRTGVNILLWTIAVYLTVSILVGTIWTYSWLIVLLGIAVELAVSVIRYYKKYLEEIKSQANSAKKQEKE